MNKSNESKVYDIAKYIAVILVVVAHSTRMYTGYGVFTPLNKAWGLFKLTEYIYKFHMPLFILLSGTVFGLCIDNGKYSQFLNFITGKAKRLLIPYYFFGFAYVAPTMCLLGLTSQSFIKYCYSGIFLSGNSRHLWYLLALFLIFILAIIAKPLIKGSRTTRFILLVCSIVLFWISDKTPYTFQISEAFSYQLYFFIGVILHYEYETFERIVQKFLYLFLLLPFALAGMFIYNPNTVTDMCYIFIGIFMVLAFAYFIETKMGWFTKKYIYTVIQKNSFGIYLFHPMIIYVFYYLLGNKDINPYILCFGIAFVATVLSIIFTKIMRALKLNILIGEPQKRKNVKNA